MRAKCNFFIVHNCLTTEKTMLWQKETKIVKSEPNSIEIPINWSRMKAIRHAEIGYIVLEFVECIFAIFSRNFISTHGVFCLHRVCKIEVDLFWIQKSKPISFCSFHWCVLFRVFLVGVFFSTFTGHERISLWNKKSRMPTNVDVAVCLHIARAAANLSLFGFVFFVNAFGYFQPRSISIVSVFLECVQCSPPPAPTNNWHQFRLHSKTVAAIVASTCK